MSLQPQAIPPIPAETARIAHAIFPDGNIYMRMHDQLGTLYQDQDFIELFPKEGQPAQAPWRLALVTVMQYVEGLTDRQAADAVRTRIDWKYAKRLDLTDTGFDFSLLPRVPQPPAGTWGRTTPLGDYAGAVSGTGMAQSAGQTANRLDACAGSYSDAQSPGSRGRNAASCPGRSWQK